MAVTKAESKKNASALAEPPAAGKPAEKTYEGLSRQQLAEIYRLNKRDDARAAEVIRSVKERFPDAPEWGNFERGGDEVMK
jgi:hypothetical protein